MITSTSHQRALIAVLAICQWVNLTYGQQPLGPAVEWRSIMPAPQKAGWGSIYEWNSTTSEYEPSTTIPNSGPLPPDEGGEDWWYAHCNIYDNGTLIGYATAGYNTVPNWGFEDGSGCFNKTISPYPIFGEFETYDHRKGQARNWIALYDLDGNQLWCRSYMPGAFYGITQASDGNIVAIGDALSNRRSEDPITGNPWPILYNPGLPNSGDDISMINCQNENLPAFEKKATIIKVDLFGNVIWQNYYGSEIAYDDAWDVGSTGWSIKSTSINGTSVLYASCSSGLNAPDDAEYILLMSLGENGNIIDRKTFTSSDPSITALGLSTVSQMRGFGLDIREIGGTKRMAISGQIRNNIFSTTQFPPLNEAFFWYFSNLDIDAFTPSYIQSTRNSSVVVPNTTTPYHDITKIQHSTGIILAEENSTPVLIWPVLSNYHGGDTWGGSGSAATLLIHRFEPNNTSQTWTVDAGPVRAYDLQADGVFTSDDQIAIVSSKSPTGQAFTYSDLSFDQLLCLDGFENFDWEDDGWEVFPYWNTDAYVAKLDLTTGSILWETTFDSDPDQPGTCFPADTRKQECLYKITEADDGGLIISGNTSHNFDDGYLAKVKSDCQLKVSYESLPLTDGVHVVTTTQTWDYDRNVRGIIKIPADVTLTIDDATIRFADSDQMVEKTQLIVEPGGRLHVQNNATLTGLDQCPNSMWDGIQLHGEWDQPQGNTALSGFHGYMHLRNFSTISNARVGVMVANDLVLGPVSDPDLRSGGIIRASNSTFKNNIYDAIFSEFENYSTYDYSIRPNRSGFGLCRFVTEGQMSRPDVAPKDHVVMTMVRGIQFRGCEFGNDQLHPLGMNPQNFGTGIRSINSSFVVGDNCGTLINYGAPCPPQYITRGTFSRLFKGIEATTFDLSRTFAVSDTDFDEVHRGIRMEGMQDASITECNFTVTDGPGMIGQPVNYGIYSDQCTGFKIQENTFASSGEANGKAGLVIKDSGYNYNTFYNNTFDNLEVGSLIQGINANNSATTGLEVKCNDYGMESINEYDVALTSDFVNLQRFHGLAIFDEQDPTQLVNPAGNRFSDHSSSQAVNDWFVQNESILVEYYHHIATPGNKTDPFYHSYGFLELYEQLAEWPSKEDACPSRLNYQSNHQLKLLAASKHAEFNLSRDEYDATRDDGETYTLLGYVSDPYNTSLQVRNALQSVAPNVSDEVFFAAFEREPAMNEWHLTEVLLSNSPLQASVMEEVYNYLPEAYAMLVENAQSGEMNVLSIIQSVMADHLAQKSMAMTEIAHRSWLDSLAFATSLDSLQLLHLELPSDNSTLAESGVYTARREYATLETMARTEAGNNPSEAEFFQLMEHFADVQQSTGWSDTTIVDHSWLANLGAQRDLQGSAQALAWLHALGDELPEEIIVMPMPQPKNLAQQQPLPSSSDLGFSVEAFPNPTNGPSSLIAIIPADIQKARLRITDISGRELRSYELNEELNILELQASTWVSGIYLADIQFAGGTMAQLKLIVQR